MSCLVSSELLPLLGAITKRDEVEETKVEIDPAAEMVLHEMADEYICGGTDIYQTLRDAYVLGYQTADTEHELRRADEIIQEWEKK